MENTGEWDPLGSSGENDKEYIYRKNSSFKSRKKKRKH